MTADSLDNFEYEPACSHESEASKRHYWAVAIGLQAVDGLVVSKYARDAADGYSEGKYTLADTGTMIRGYHAADGEALRNGDMGSREADLVSQRIAELLAGAPFVLSKEMLPQVHRYIFQDMEPELFHPGEFKTERMVKQERILNGDSVLYADPIAYDMSLSMYFSSEQKKHYGTTLSGEELANFARNIAFLWQIHPFTEGNTRTIAVFSELYLNSLGFTIGNEPFESNSRYYRDALVRAMYRNAAAGISQDTSFITNFYDNAINDAGHTLNREDLICTQLFEHPELLRNISPEEALSLRQ